MSNDPRFFAFLKERIGLDVASVGEAIIERAVRQRSQAVAAHTADEYWQHLQHSQDEQQALIEAVIVPETWFFRYPESFATLARLAKARLAEVDLVLAHGPLSPALRADMGAVPVFSMQLQGGDLRALRGRGDTRPARDFRGRRVHAVAGIGRPQRFFDQLAGEGIEVVPHAFPDHHRFVAGDLVFAEALPILMTAKDAVKCAPFAPADCWEYPVRAQIGSGAAERILEKLEDGRTSA